MKLLPIESRSLLETVAEWLSRKENYQWLDFGHGVQALTPLSLKLMTQRDIHCLRAFTADDDVTPVGIVGLSNVHRPFRTATLWTVLGSRVHGGMGRRATTQMLAYGFHELGLYAVNAWTVETNVAARRGLERLRFTYFGRQRKCHYIDGRPLDRLWYDLLAEEFCEDGHDDG